MKQDDLVDSLVNLGLKPTDTQVYLAALEQGPSTVLTLARSTRIKRGTVYEIVDRLVSRGFLRITRAGSKRRFVAEDPRAVSSRFEEYSHTFKNAVPNLLAIQSQDGVRPKVTYYEGEAEVWRIYEDTLSEGQPISSYTSVADLYGLLNPRRIESYIQRRVQKQIPIRIIALDSPESRRWASRGPDEFRETRLIPEAGHHFVADVEIYGIKVAMVSFKKNIFGIVIENEQISQMQQVAFDLLWSHAAAYSSGGRASS